MQKKEVSPDVYNRERVLSQQECQHCIAALRALLHERFGDNQTSAARALHVSQQAVSRALSQGVIGRALATSIARERGMSLEQLLAAAVDPWPNRTLAVEIAKEAGATRAQIAPVLAVAYDGSKDLPRLVWAMRMCGKKDL